MAIFGKSTKKPFIKNVTFDPHADDRVENTDTDMTEDSFRESGTLATASIHEPENKTVVQLVVSSASPSPTLLAPIYSSQ